MPIHPPAAGPFLKWAGGKTQLLPQLSNHYPAELAAGEIDTYIEPFLGGGAVFLHVAQTFPLRHAYLFDINPELVLVYRVVQRAADALLDRLANHQARYQALEEDARERYFYTVRERYNQKRFAISHEDYSADWIPRAADMIFLNRTCFNGLYRVNSKGKFNVPFGRYKHPKICDRENILGVAALLQRATLATGHFSCCQSLVGDRTFVYFDPPYRPLSRTASFTAYAKAKFDDRDQRELARFYRTLDARHDVRLMLSNSDPTNTDPNDTFFHDLYSGFHTHRVYANRMINANADRRGKITELLITNYSTANADS